MTYRAILEETATLSPREIAAQERSEWVAELRTHGISLLGDRGRRYQTTSGQSVTVAFANEQPHRKNRWFLDLPDEPTDIAVFLCKSLEGKLYDIVLPVSDLPEVWDVLSSSKSRNQVKFEVKRDAALFLMWIPKRKERLNVTRYIGNYDPLR